MSFLNGPGTFYSAGGDGWRLCNSLQRLAVEIEQAMPTLVCGGTKGNPEHQLQGVNSDHNPFVTDPGTGIGIVRAMDVSGPEADLMTLRAHLYSLAQQGFGPLAGFGFLKGPDSEGTPWPIGSGWNFQTGDEGHLHISVTQKDGFNPVAGPNGYVAAIDSLDGWGISGAAPINLEDKDWLDMATEKQVQDAVTAALQEYFANGEGNPRSGRVAQAVAPVRADTAAIRAAMNTMVAARFTELVNDVSAMKRKMGI